VESVLRPEGSLWWERFVKKVDLEPGVKERELWMVRVVSWERRRCGRSMNMLSVSHDREPCKNG